MTRTGIGSFLALSWILAWPAVAMAEDVFQVQNKHAGTSDWVFDRDSGRLFALIKRRGDVIEFDPATGKVRRTFNLGGLLDRAVLKGSVLAVHDSSNSTLHLLDLMTNKVKATIPLAHTDPRAILLTSHQKNPWVYLALPIPMQRYPRFLQHVRVIQIDATQGRKVHSVQLSLRAPVPLGSFDGALARNGKRMLLKAGANVALVGFKEGPKVGASGPVQFRRVPGVRGSAGIGPGLLAAGVEGWIDSGRLLDAAAQRLTRRYDGWPLVLHPTEDLALSWVHSNQGAAGRLRLYRFSSGKRLRDVDLVPSMAASPHTYAPVELFLDPKRGRVICCLKDQAWIVQLKNLTYIRAPLLRIHMPPLHSVRVGSNLSIDLRLNRSDLRDKVKFELVSGPAGLSLSKGKLLWKPSSAQFGVYEVVVRASLKGATAVGKTKISVSREGEISLPDGIEWRSLTTDEAGRWALLLGEVPSQRSSTRVVVVDLVQQRIRGDQQFPFIRAGVITDPEVYLVPRWRMGGPSHMFRFRLPLSDRTKIPTKLGVAQVGALPNGRLAIHDRTGVWEYDSKTHRKIRQLSRTINPGDAFLRPAPDTIRVGGLVLGRAKGKIRMLCAPLSGVRDILASELPPALAQKLQYGVCANAPSLWGRAPEPRSHTRIYRRGALSTPILLREAPARTLVRYVRGNGVLLEIRDLVEHKVHASIRIIKPRGYPQSRAILACGRTRVVVAYGNRMFLVPLPKGLKKMSAPVEFDYRFVPRPLAHTAKPVTITLGARGGKGRPYTYKLLGPTKGVSLDPAGKITLRPAELWSLFLNKTRGWAERGRPFNPSLFKLGLKLGQATCKNSFGIATKQYPVTLSIPLRVTDSEGQQATLQPRVLILGPVAEVREASERKR